MSEREEFEQFVINRGLFPEILLVGTDQSGKYVSETAQDYWETWQAARAASPKVPQGVEEWLVGCEHCATIENNVLAFNMASNLRAYLSGMAIVPVEPTEKMLEAGVSIALSTSIHGQGGWNAYLSKLYAAMLAATKEKGE